MVRELALKLKNAGFPDKYTKDCKCLPVLSLSNLIDACGDEFYSVRQFETGKWEARSKTIVMMGSINYGYANPEEAVAFLWLRTG